MKLTELKEWTDVLTPIAGAVAIAVGGVFAMVQYLDKKHDDRVKETLAFFDRYNSNHVLEARTVLVSAWLRHAAEYEQVIGSADKYYAFTRRVIHDENLRREVAVINDFFAALDICARNKICECEVALLLFQPDARSYYGYHYSFIAAERSRAKDDSIGAGLESFAKIGRGKPAGSSPDCTD
ncbi:hypothetical protein [Massilia sp. DD77]|uniref:hypothetical protein n=1 Tax=Massilia sp. DD77 TaxID=3109349 RepID=UPI002FFF9F31